MAQKQSILAGWFIDGESTSIRRNIVITMQNGIITNIRPALDESSTDNNTSLTDFSHCTILPALVDCSVSLTQSPAIATTVQLTNQFNSLAEKSIILKQNIHHYHSHGVLGVANHSDITNLSKPQPEEMAPETMINIVTSGQLWQNKDDYQTAKWDNLDFLKIAYSPNIDNQQSPPPNLNQQDLAYISLNRGNKKVVAIANGQDHVANALASNCHAIEQGYDMGTENLKKMAANNILWIPSLLRAKNALDNARTGGSICCRFSGRFVAPGQPEPGAEEHWQRILAQQLKQLRLAKNLGIRTIIGTGSGSAGIIHGESMAEEMKLFIKAGYSLTETIHSASSIAAEFFNIKRLGTLTVGQPATFLITRGTAQQLPRKLSYLEGIYITGHPSPTYHKN